MRPLQVMASGVLCLAGACKGPTGVDPKLPTLLVTNHSCDLGQCATLQIRAFVPSFPLPGQPQIGSEVVGEAPPGQSCLVFPSSWTAVDVTIYPDGRRDTTTFTWNPDDPAGIYLVAVDTPVQRSGQSYAPRTPLFVPGNAPGWELTVPAAAVSITAGEACSPG